MPGTNRRGRKRAGKAKTLDQDYREFFAPRTTVDQASGCWEWQGAKGSAGANQKVWSKALRKAVQPSRFMFLWSGKVIPDGHRVVRTCRNWGCVNPEHLAAVEPPEKS